MLRIDTIHHYPHPATRTSEAFCRLRIYDTKAGAVVVLSELADNPGISVTNTAEELATGIAQRYALDPQTTTWIEHYGPFSYHAKDGDGGDPDYETFDKITFTWRGNLASGPQWKRLSPEQIKALLPDDDIGAATPPNEVTEQRRGIFITFLQPDGKKTTARFAESYGDDEIKTIAAQFSNGIPLEWHFNVLTPAMLDCAKTMPIIAGKEGNYTLAPASTVDFTPFGGIAKAQEEAAFWNRHQLGTR